LGMTAITNRIMTGGHDGRQVGCNPSGHSTG
jgi:hypothetical protein